VIAAAIPIYNEAATIGHVVGAVRDHVDEVLVVDDGSTDAGADLAAAAGATVLRRPRNGGKGVALQAALEWARGRSDLSALVLLDGDGQHDPADIPRLLEALQSRDLDIVVGSRFLGKNNAPIYRLLGLHVLSACAALGSGIRLTDSQSGYRALSHRAVAALNPRERAFSVETEMQFIAAGDGLLVDEVPIAIHYSGPARRSPVAHGLSVLLQTLKMTAQRRPMRLALLVATPVLALRIGRVSNRTGDT
jgi:glycosyltransferase involved in cell wall biosynthesis